MRRLRRILTLKPREVVALADALQTVLRIRLAIARRRTDAVRAATAALGAEAEAPAAELRRVAWSVSAASRLVPGATCLTQALAGQRLLARRGYVSTVRISLPGGGEADFRPHAWLLSGNVIALGGSAADYGIHRPLLDYDSAGRADAAHDVSAGTGP
ncbi:lasso peptide biosynthesis B2 protein [Rhodobacter sp. CZR27]|uniref:lasso peptide biosynthesis B2 protein n=1 Tax=Rhodobacter sp. CZR27 TaxID=2033869 RepID=UPI000BBF0D91|nr:lasso peptide biosynthesis B2 protein [Rhodobacter sp. CZR27]